MSLHLCNKLLLVYSRHPVVDASQRPVASSQPVVVSHITRARYLRLFRFPAPTHGEIAVNALRRKGHPVARPGRKGRLLRWRSVCSPNRN